MRVSTFLDIEARVESEEESEYEQEDEEEMDLDEMDTDALPQTQKTPSPLDSSVLVKYVRPELQSIIDRYGGSQNSGTECGSSAHPLPGDTTSTGRADMDRSAGVESLRPIIAPILNRNPNDAVATIVGINNERMEAKSDAQRAFEMARWLGNQEARIEDYEGPPRSMKDWARWAAMPSRKAPVDFVPSQDFAPGEWVTVRGGTYDGDHAMVFDKSKETSASKRYVIFLLPRLTPPHIRDIRFNGIQSNNTESADIRRPPPCLFKPNEFRSARRLKLLQQEDNGDAENDPAPEHAVYKYQRQSFSYGLLAAAIAASRLRPTQYISPECIGPFSKHPFCRNFPFPLSELTWFEEGEEVIVARPEEWDFASTLNPLLRGTSIWGIQTERPEWRMAMFI
ncbi:hypothetical protein AAF712_011181 [Marasmius tenuissimus]|uniref:Uncharacterized protein n=1 Tax=Marasmius tenuissimus TaxID=585030 RepID=A0ABR2ZJW7_9AGAR